MAQREGRDRHQSSTEPHTSDTRRPAKQPKEQNLPSQGLQTNKRTGGTHPQRTEQQIYDHVLKMRYIYIPFYSGEVVSP